MTKPASIRWAIYLLIGSLVVAVPFVWIGASAAPERLSRGFLFGFIAVINLIWVGLAYFMGRGRQWARVLLAIGAVLTLWGSRGGPPEKMTQPVMIAHYWFQLVVMLAVLILILLPSSTEWFRAQKELRKKNT